MSKFTVGCHLSAAKGFLAMGQEAVRIGADTFQFFTRNPRGGAARAWSPEDRLAYLAYAGEHHLAPMLAHAPYTLNPCGKDARVREFAMQVFGEDLDRLAPFPGTLYNFHPGSHVGQGAEEGIRLITALLTENLPRAAGTTILLETMPGKGSEMGRDFVQLARIIEAAKGGEALGVCLDTCHVYDGGYDIAEQLEEVLAEFDRVLGLSRLKAIHLNDSKTPFASHKDRHEKLGEGSLGWEVVTRIINHPALRELPFYLETPQADNDGYAREIAALRARRS